MTIEVKYTDGTMQTYDDVEDAEEGIRETVTGCDFAAQVESVEMIEGDTRRELYCSWSVKLHDPNK